MKLLTNKIAVINKENNIIQKNLFSWHERFLFWHFFFSGFYFDELFSRFINSLFIKYLTLPGLFILDKIFSQWTGVTIIKKLTVPYNNVFFPEKIELNNFFNLLVYSINFSIFFLIVFFCII